jgi:hypothetical protein
MCVCRAARATSGGSTGGDGGGVAPKSRHGACGTCGAIGAARGSGARVVRAGAGIGARASTSSAGGAWLSSSAAALSAEAEAVLVAATSAALVVAERADRGNCRRALAAAGCDKSGGVRGVLTVHGGAAAGAHDGGSSRLLDSRTPATGEPTDRCCELLAACCAGPLMGMGPLMGLGPLMYARGMTMRGGPVVRGGAVLLHVGGSGVRSSSAVRARLSRWLWALGVSVRGGVPWGATARGGVPCGATVRAGGELAASTECA